MQPDSKDDQRHVDSRQIVGEPARQVNVRDRATLGADPLSDLRERAPEPVRREDQALASDDTGGDRSPAIGPPCEPRPKHVHDTGFNREPRERVDQLDGRQRGPGAFRASAGALAAFSQRGQIPPAASSPTIAQ